MNRCIRQYTPVCFTVLYPGGGDQFATVRLSGTNVPATIRAIEQKWQEFTTKQPFQYDFFSDSWEHLYSSEMKTGKIFILFSFLAILIACLGLLGLITYITNKRTREIGIRKTYGASIKVVLGLLSREVVFLILDFIANCLSCCLFRFKVLAGRICRQSESESADFYPGNCYCPYYWLAVNKLSDDKGGKL